MYKINSIIKREFRIFYILILFFRLLLDIAYEYIIATRFQYMGFFNNKTIILSIASWVVLVVYMIICRDYYTNCKNQLSKEIVYWLFLISFIPFTSLMKFGLLTTLFTVCNLLYWLLLIIGVGGLKIKAGRTYTLKKKRFVNDTHIQFITILSFAIVLFVSGRYAGFRFHFDLLDVYDLRLEARSFHMPTIFTYLFAWTRTINSILEAYFIRRRKWEWAIACFAMQLLNFGVDGSKTTLFMAFFAIIINVIPKIEIRKMNLWVLYGAISITLLSMGMFLFANKILLASLVIRRVFYIPAYIQTCYFDFFTHHVPDYFRNSFMRYFGIKGVYPNISYLIGRSYFNQEAMSANNGLISDAIANLGYVGIVFMPLLLSYILKMLDRASEGLDIRLYFTVAMYSSIVLVNSFLFTVLMTHGLLVVLILLTLMKRDHIELNQIGKSD